MWGECRLLGTKLRKVDGASRAYVYTFPSNHLFMNLVNEATGGEHASDLRKEYVVVAEVPHSLTLEMEPAIRLEDEGR